MNTHQIEQVINLKDEKNFEEQVQAVIRLHDMIKESPDSMIKDIARFMPPMDSRVVVEAIQRLKDRNKK